VLDALKTFRIYFLTFLIECIFRLLRMTWRIVEAPLPLEAQNRLKENKTLVYAHWHEDEWALLGVFAGREMAVLVSESQDGSIMARLLEKFGFRVLRGSSSKSAVKGFLQLLRTVRKEKIKSVSLAVDGPRGPRNEAKAGIVKLGESLGGPLVLGAAYADRAWVFRKSWSHAFVPKPFAKIFVEYTMLSLDTLEQSDELKVANVKKTLLEAKELARKKAKSSRQ
jgi:lysophospholipid acyltransferase (LPLAT)-like uncharacterized protein